MTVPFVSCVAMDGRPTCPRSPSVAMENRESLFFLSTHCRCTILNHEDRAAEMLRVTVLLEVFDATRHSSPRAGGSQADRRCGDPHLRRDGLPARDDSGLRACKGHLSPLSDRLRSAVDYAVASGMEDSNERSFRAHSWTQAAESPELRQILRDRHTEMVAFSRLVLQEAVVRGELPGWIDADRIASAFVTLIDGFVVRAIEAADLSAEDARREAYSLLELLLAAPAAVPEAVQKLRASAVGAAG